ncbi:MAG: DivIVA domain-containing protein [Candidatus Aldehydirespiratoraceae bacterium]|jgi:DivIVA domain-containing protein
MFHRRTVTSFRQSADGREVIPRASGETHPFGVARRGYDKAEVNAYLNRLAADVEAEVEQARQLAAARELFEREHARSRHEAEMAAIAIRQRGEQDAAAARAAAALAQAKAEIEATKQEALTRAREMLALGKGIIATIIGPPPPRCDASLTESAAGG